jgi:hypothetical protein
MLSCFFTGFGLDAGAAAIVAVRRFVLVTDAPAPARAVPRPDAPASTAHFVSLATCTASGFCLPI